jgi:hypothetical protein
MFVTVGFIRSGQFNGGSAPDLIHVGVTEALSPGLNVPRCWAAACAANGMTAHDSAR